MKNIFIFLMILFFSCKPKQDNYTIMKKNVRTYDINDKIPENSQKIKKIKYGRNIIKKNLDYDSLIEKAKEEAIENNGNAIKIIYHKPLDNSFNGPIHLMKFWILKINTEVDFEEKEKVEFTKPKNYAYIHLYRYGGGYFIGYNLHVGDSIVKIKNSFKKTFKIKKRGKYLIWAKKGKEIELDIELGKEYYLKCGTKVGFFANKPDFQIKDSIVGKKEYDSFFPENK